MTSVIIETRVTPSKTAAQAINRRRWTSYAESLSKHTTETKMAYRSLMILMGSINARQRWVRITKEEFLTYLPEWTEQRTEQDWSVQHEGREERLHIYFNPKSEKYYFSRLIKRNKDVSVLPGWHVAAMNGIRSRGIVMTQGLSDELYKVGLMIVKSIREEEGIWRKVNNPMLNKTRLSTGV